MIAIPPLEWYWWVIIAFTVLWFGGFAVKILFEEWGSPLRAYSEADDA